MQDFSNLVEEVENTLIPYFKKLKSVHYLIKKRS